MRRRRELTLNQAAMMVKHAAQVEKLETVLTALHKHFPKMIGDYIAEIAEGDLKFLDICWDLKALFRERGLDSTVSKEADRNLSEIAKAFRAVNKEIEKLPTPEEMREGYQ